MERFARRGLKLRWFGFAIVLFLVMPSWLHAARPVMFNLSTAKTYAVGEKPTIHLYSQNVDELEFRIYRVDDPAKFLSGLKDLHSFGQEDWGPKEQIDERTWLEKFHDWKHHIWFLIRRFFRNQFSAESRDALREKQATLARRSRVVGVAQFAQIPLLNDRQLVARWKQEMPPTYVSDSQDLPIDPLGAGLYLVEATDGHYKAYTVLFVSNMALVTRTTNGTVLAYAVDRKTGAPQNKVQIRMGIKQQQVAEAETGEDGLVELHGPVSKAMQENIWVIAKSGNDVAAVTPASYAFSGSESSKWASYVYTDRPVYRPGHTVHWKAILRTKVANHLEVPKPQQVHVTVTDQEDHAVLEKDMTTSAEGTVAGDVELRANAGLGYYTIRIGEMNDGAMGSFRVEEYRKPEYQVRVGAAKPRVLQGEKMQVTIDSRYFFGEPVANAVVKYKVFHAPHYWWGDEGDDAGAGMGAAEDAEGSADDSLGYGADQESEQTGKLDANGKLTITVPTAMDSSNRKMDQDYTIEAGVTDAANREVTGRGHFLATYGSFRVHVEPASYAVRQGAQAAFQVSAVDYDNHPVQTRMHVALVERKWVNGKTVTTQGPSTDVTTDAAGNGRALLSVTNAGSMEVIATATTPEKRTVQDTSWLWVMGSGEESLWGGTSQQVQIIADKKKYAVGDVAHLSIVSQVASFHALVTATGNAVQFQKVLSSDGKTLSWDMPITSDSVPNLQVDAVFIENGQMYEASKNIKVPPVEKQLQVEITPARQVFQPQQTAQYDVLLKDSAGKPVAGADLSFGVVDEAIYSLYPDTSGDMVKRLYPERYVYAEVMSSLDYSFSGRAGAKSPLLAERKSRYNPRMAQVKPGNDVVQPKVRKAFPDTAYWAPDVRTDAQGHAKVTMTFPDSLTTWRATVRAITADSKAGSQINRVIVRKNVIVRMGTPRFMRKGDEITIPVIAHNYLDTAKQMQLQLEVQGLDAVAGSPQTVTVPSKGDGIATWRLKASQIGTAKLLAKALTNEESDALEVTFPVEPSGVPVMAGGNGAITQTDGASHTPVNFPANTDAAAHGLHVEVSPSIAGSIFPALAYLTSYPYGCTEQTMSSFLPNVIVAETLKKLNVTGRVDENDLRAKVQAGLDRLKDYQHDDGGWGWWKEDESRVFMTAYVVSGLAEAARSMQLNDDAQSMKQKGTAYLEKQLADHPRMLPELRAYTVYALIEAGKTDHGKDLDTLYGRKNDLSAEGLSMVGLAMLDVNDRRVESVAKLVEGKVQRQGELASWPSRYSPLLDFEYDNTAESTAYALRFLTKADPKSPLLDAAAQWLVLNRTGGYWWESTEQTAMVLFGLVDYMAASKELSADFDIDVVVNGVSVAKRHFTAADAMSGAGLSVDVAADKLQPANNAVQVVKHGAGKAYWLVQGKYYSTEKRLYQAGTMNLNVTRDYFKLVPTQKDGKIVYQLQPLRGATQIGDVLAVHLAVNGSPMKYLLIEDPIPAGTEFVQHEDSYNIVDKPGNWDWWYTRREFHDDRAAMFATEFDGRHESFYLLKVVNPGAFVVSPAHVEPMYQPGIQATTEEIRLQADPAQDGAAQGVHP
ncbi:alpha-2-macroglobulin family protein [Edaphobacter flagellatus]|uniref:alpha-2-macroglobulin family protein n=1 Tax=Edaphobacter flagellatus TaxID=1933044 RepID=UPI0021B4C680|nr:MG2 domain-containing protein [Edaphobacter flagellatus]